MLFTLPKVNACWITADGGMIWIFLAPVTLVLFFNIGVACFAVMTAYKSAKYRASFK